MVSRTGQLHRCIEVKRLHPLSDDSNINTRIDKDHFPIPSYCSENSNRAVEIRERERTSRNTKLVLFSGLPQAITMPSNRYSQDAQPAVLKYDRLE